MNYTLEQALASFVRFIQEQESLDGNLYLDKLPEDFQVPSIYFPVPLTESRQTTFGTWLVEIYVDVWFMGINDWAANAMAVNVRDSLLRNRCLIDMVECDGALTGKKFRVTEPKIRKTGDRCVVLSSRIRNYVSFDNGSIPVLGYTFTGAFESHIGNGNH